MKPHSKVHHSHKTDPKGLQHWLYCRQCGLVYLRNDVTRKEMRKPCKDSEA